VKSFATVLAGERKMLSEGTCHGVLPARAVSGWLRARAMSPQAQ